MKSRGLNAVWLGSLLIVAVADAWSADIIIKRLPSPHADYECRIDPSTSSAPLCPAFFNVQAFPVVDVAGSRVTACLAVFPYNKLTIHTGPNGASAPFALTWKLPSPGDLYFASLGVSLTPPDNRVAEDLFDPPQPVVSADRSMVTLTVRAGATGMTKDDQFAHLPVVLFRAAGGYTSTTGKQIRCIGVDPIIVNSAD